MENLQQHKKDVPADSCAVCENPQKTNLGPWMQKCKSCGFLSSTLDVVIGESPDTAEKIDEDVRFLALKALREKNYTKILTTLKSQFSAGQQSVLDIGCAYGWFLDLAKTEKMQTYGVEPDACVITPAMRENHTLWQGFFPGIVPADKKFDVIIFNDVFEHLPDVGEALDACHKHLEDDGILVINLPNKNGIFYRLATILKTFGMSKPMDRMWQKDFPSPHLSYFSPSLLEKLTQRHGFHEIERQRLETLTTKGLWERILYDQTMNIILSRVIYAAVFCLVPLLSILPPDITVQYFRKDK